MPLGRRSVEIHSQTTPFSAGSSHRSGGSEVWDQMILTTTSTRVALGLTFGHDDPSPMPSMPPSSWRRSHLK